jgi:tetratricopeptide (TPR) repeat protein
VVGLVGEPGVGKSRLVYECTRALPASGWQILASRADVSGQATSYRPVIDLVKAACHVEAGEALPATRRKVLDRLTGREASEALPAVLSLLGVPVENPAWEALEPAHRRRRIQEAVKDLLLGDRQRPPVLLVVEDLQWVDGESQAVLDRLVESLPAARLLLLASYRPEYQHGWAGKTYCTQLRLDPLSPASAEDLLQAFLGGDPSLAPLTRLLSERTEGNPFFLEECLHTLVETQVLAGERGAYALVASSPRLQVPATVQAVLAARIDRLAPAEKHLLQTAAVIGTDVPLPLLHALVESGAEAIDRGLGRLQAAEFLYQTHLWPEAADTFKHALTQEVAYETLPPERRRTLHVRIIEALERLAPDRLADEVERLAHHALRGEVWDKALAYGRQAGEKAMACSAYREATKSFEQALRALPHLPETRDTREQAIDLRLALRSALRPFGEFGRILALLREAEALAAALDDPRRLGQVSRFLATHFVLMGAHDQAIAFAQRALTLAAAEGDVILCALANCYLGQAYQAQGNYRRAIDYYKQTEASLEGARRRERFGQVFLPAVVTRTALAACHAELGTFAEGGTLGEEGLQIAEAAAYPDSLMAAYYHIGLVSLRQGNLSRAIPLLERAVGLCQDVDLPFWFPIATATLGNAYALCGRDADAMLLLTQAVEQSAALETIRHQMLCRLSLGEAQVLAGRLEEAYGLAGWVLAHAREHQERGNQAYALRLLGDIAARREPPESVPAEAHYRQALALAEELGMRPLQAHCHLGLGTLYVKSGLREQAHAELTTAIDLYRAMEMTFWLPQAEVALAKVAGC